MCVLPRQTARRRAVAAAQRRGVGVAARGRPAGRSRLRSRCRRCRTGPSTPARPPSSGPRRSPARARAARGHGTRPGRGHRRSAAHRCGRRQRVRRGWQSRYALGQRERAQPPARSMARPCATWRSWLQPVLHRGLPTTCGLRFCDQRSRAPARGHGNDQSATWTWAQDCCIWRIMTYDADILIVGGGLNGPALALALAGTGLKITLVDALPRSKSARRRVSTGAPTRLRLPLSGCWTGSGCGPGVGPSATHAENRGQRRARGRRGGAILSCNSTMPRSRKARWATCWKTAICARTDGRDGCCRNYPAFRRNRGCAIGDDGPRATVQLASGRQSARAPSGGLRRARQRHSRARRHSPHGPGLRPDRVGLRGRT